MKAIIKRAINEQFFFTLIANNGKVVATGETYHRKSAVKRVLKNCFPAFTVIDKTGNTRGK